ncbi:hypothetical protein PR048_024544 [Dryococelus australis]|uniref:Uncharacterized protein n=1 Tax=Dryococelus australis TaxID=614101 RepID=A0ABQ9GNU5_9NEOP|nr:hypothetical protein PR048_024544 [Dryococelus australis]
MKCEQTCNNLLSSWTVFACRLSAIKARDSNQFPKKSKIFYRAYDTRPSPPDASSPPPFFTQPLAYTISRLSFKFRTRLTNYSTFSNVTCDEVILHFKIYSSYDIPSPAFRNHRDARMRVTGDPRENPLTIGIVRSIFRHAKVRKLDSSVLCTLEPQLCVHWLLPRTWQFWIRRVFPCKSTIGSEACRMGLTNCDPVAKWLACSPPTKAIRAQYPAGSLRIFASGNCAGTMPLAGGFSRGSPVSRAVSFRRCSILTSNTPLDSQDLDDKNLFHCKSPCFCLHEQSLSRVRRTAMWLKYEGRLTSNVAAVVVACLLKAPRLLSASRRHAVIDGRTYPSLYSSLGDGLMGKDDALRVTLAYISGLFSISSPIAGWWRGFLHLAFRNEMLQSYSCPCLLFKGVIRKAVCLRPDHIIAETNFSVDCGVGWCSSPINQRHLAACGILQIYILHPRMAPISWPALGPHVKELGGDMGRGDIRAGPPDVAALKDHFPISWPRESRCNGMPPLFICKYKQYKRPRWAGHAEFELLCVYMQTELQDAVFSFDVYLCRQLVWHFPRALLANQQGSARCQQPIPSKAVTQSKPTRVIETCMEQHRNERGGGKREIPEKIPPTSGIVGHDSPHVRGSGGAHAR